MNSILLALVLCWLPVSQVLASGQAADARQEDIQQDYRVGPGDSLLINVFGSNEFDQTIRVSNSGKIHVPHLGILKVIDRTPSQIQDEIARQLVERDFMKEPWVQVRIAEYRAHPVYILGEVMQPGQFLIRDEMHVMDLISLTAGFNDVASPIGYLYRRKVESSDAVAGDSGKQSVAEEAIEINFQQLYDGSRPELNMRLQGGDVLYVPQRRDNFFFIVGDVLGTGAFTIPFGQKVLATQAIAKAGGPMKTAKMSKGILMRYDQNGKRQELAVDFKAILQGKKPDFPLMPNDIIFIPGSNAKTIGYGLLNIVPRLAMTAVVF
jgi:polysaccharide biosynthesis/export protein